ncbi:dachshund homolog 2 isoform X4 [Bombyx mandarina]|uniref:SKI/SNO/DAC domain-containing protein n=2 Tax=Bombyx TaxID=7090 RepID=A0A8R2QXB3_BOMMO|nr:dachshund homolog 2 isoform X4 [Bombyx mandarina]XP_037870416.1 dachshund homolog 2 isoform X6 [Bombyx mori]
MESAVDSASTASEVSGSSGGSPRVKAASPARALSPPQLMAPRLPLPPPGLGLLGSLQMMHHSPLELMAAAHHHGPPRYGSPPPISTSDPSANECKLVDYRGQKVAAFIIQGDTMLCLPQAFELFLKHLVGGLHTVYTKLKRLDIVPLVCNVEQVRILRGLGAIQPGVNRCKLLSCKDFDVLYKDCTTARYFSSSRPGRPPKRATGVGLSLAATQFPGHPFKKHRLENGDYSPYENGHMSEMARLEKSPLLANGYNAPPTHLGPMGFMHQHALMSPGMPHHGVPRPDGSIIKGQPMHNMEALARSGIWENCRAAYEDIVKHLERLRDERGDMERVMAMDKAREGSHNGSSPGHSPVLNLSKSGSGGDRERSDRNDRERGERGDGSASGRSSAASRRTPQPPRMPSTATAAVSPRSHSDDSDAPLSDQDDHNVKDEDEVYYLSSGGDMSDGERDIPASTSPAPVSYPPPTVTPTSVPVDPTADTLVSSTETLLRNIQGLLKVAADNARQQERQISYEKAELKMDVLREREVKDNLERQLVDEQKLRVIYQKRLKKERKQRQVVQEQLDIELKRRQKIEEALKQSGAPQEILRIVTENLSPAGQEQGRHERENGSESKPPSTEPPSTSPPFQRDPPRTPDKPQWNYPPPPVDIMSGGAAFWQNYSESLAQELEMERKSRQQAMERDVKSPLSDRAGYYKNSVLFSSAT